MADELTGGADAVVKLAADTSGWDQALNRTDAAMSGWSGRVGSKFAAVSGLLESRAGAAASAISQSGSAATAAAHSFGLSTEGLQQFTSAAQLAGLAAGGIHVALAGLAILGVKAIYDLASSADHFKERLKAVKAQAEESTKAVRESLDVRIADVVAEPSLFRRLERQRELTDEVAGAVKRLRDEQEKLQSDVRFLSAPRFGPEAVVREEEITARGDNLEILNARLAGVNAQLEVATAAQKRVTTETGKADGAAAALAAKLEFQAATFGVTAEAAELYALKLQGVAESRLENIRGLQIMNAELAKQKKATEDAAAAAVAQEQKIADAADAAAEALKRRGEALTQSVLTPQEKYNQSLREASELLIAGTINGETFRRASEAAEKQLTGIAAKVEVRTQAPLAAVQGSREAATAIANLADRPTANTDPAAKAAAAAEKQLEVARNTQRAVEKGNEMMRRVADVLENIDWI